MPFSFSSTSKQNLNLYATVIQEKNTQLIEQFLAKHGPIYSADDSGREIIYDDHGPGEYVGEMALVRSQPRSAALWASTRSSCQSA